MTYQILAFIPIVIFILIHFFAKKATRLGKVLHGRFLSIGGGVALAYVFLDLLPKLCDSEIVIAKALEGLLPYLEKHVYIIALFGFLLFFLIDRSGKVFGKRGNYIASFASYALFNFFVGYAIVDENNPEVQPLVLFTIAVALHYFTNDYALTKTHGEGYGTTEKWFLTGSLLLGWVLGFFSLVPQASIAMIDAFIGGGMVMNVIRHELPSENRNSLYAFVISAVTYGLILLFLGAY